MSHEPIQGSLWRQIQRKNFTRFEELLAFLEIDAEKSASLLKTPRFPLNLPRRLAEKIPKGTTNDPIFRQFVPLHEEEKISAGFMVDPVSDRTFQKKKKFLQKYFGRALIISTGACAMHCRFCFRQNFPYEWKEHGFAEEVAHIAADTSLSEIILSGGDPLSLEDHVLRKFLYELNAIEHVKRIRFHTRFPIGIPERIDDSFLEILGGLKKQVIFIVHTNHPRELDADVLNALRKVLKLGIPVLTHSVLLKGVNDDKEVLEELFTRLVDHGILPYYLNQLDKVQGAAHFEVPENKGISLIDSLQETLSGYALPRYAKEVPGAKSKTFITKS